MVCQGDFTVNGNLHVVSRSYFVYGVTMNLILYHYYWMHTKGYATGEPDQCTRLNTQQKYKSGFAMAKFVSMHL